LLIVLAGAGAGELFELLERLPAFFTSSAPGWGWSE
jgi:hypothetical protein